MVGSKRESRDPEIECVGNGLVVVLSSANEDVFPATTRRSRNTRATFMKSGRASATTITFINSATRHSAGGHFH